MSSQNRLESKRKVVSTSSTSDANNSISEEPMNKSRVKQDKKKPKTDSEKNSDKNVKQTTLDSFTDTQKFGSQLEKMSKTLEQVLACMVKISDLDERLKPLVTKDQLDQIITNLQDDIETKNVEIIERLESRVLDLESENDALKHKLRSLDNKIEQCEEKAVNNVKTKKTDTKLNDLEQQGRKNSMRLFGVEDRDFRETGEDCIKTVLKVLNENVKVRVDPSDIDVAHRLGKFDEKRPRAILCKFTKRITKFDVLHKRRNLKDTRMGISEDLTKQNILLLNNVKALSCVQSAWTRDCKIIALLSNGRKIRITSDMPLNDDHLLNL